MFNEPLTVYLNGQIQEEKLGWDVDTMSYIDLKKVIDKLGYKSFKCLWYRNPKLPLARGLKPLNSDSDILQLAEDAVGFAVVDVYVEHLIDTPLFYEGRLKGRGKNFNDFEDVDVVVIDEAEDTVEEEGEVEVEVDDQCDADDEHDSDVSEVADSDFEENWDWTACLEAETFTQTDPPIYQENEADLHGGDTAAATNSDIVDEDGDSDELDTPPGSDVEDDGKVRFPQFKVPENDEDLKFEVGMQFSNKKQILEAIKTFALVSKKNLKFKKNDNKRVIATCKTSCCPFYLRVTKSRQATYWQVVTFIKEHCCFRSAKNRQATPDWLAKRFMPLLRHTPDMKPKALIAFGIEKWGIKLTVDQVYRAKVKAMEKIEGASRDQYKHLRSYAAELLDKNKNSTVKIKCDLTAHGPVFERIYVCLEACKAAFATTCRPLIGLDGCFLKGQFGGQLLTAIGKDGNNQMLPIAYAVVESENYSSWKWFVELLLADLDGIQQASWAFISDQQKGLVEVIKDLGENVEHRLCVKHLYGNWRKKYAGAQMKELMWMAARASTVPEWEKAMKQIKANDENAWKDLHNIKPAAWTRSAFKLNSKCDLQVNNMCEAFNKAILEYRDKPIISLLEGIRFYISSRIVKLRTMMMRYQGMICPKIQQIIEKNKKASDGWLPHWSGDENLSMFEVSKGIEKFVVRLKEHTCSCRKWDLTGIPCPHSIACMWQNGTQPEAAVNSYYRKSTLLSTYSFIVYPCNGPNLWPPEEGQVMLPPVTRRAPGRPKKMRNKSKDEPKSKFKIQRQSKSVICKNCGTISHNKRTCKGKTAADRNIPKGGNKNLKRNSAPNVTQAVQKKQKNDASTSGTTTAGTEGGDTTNLTQASQVTSVGPHTQQSVNGVGMKN